MIITLTGKPCSGKSTVANIFCKKYKFEHLSTGKIFRAEAEKLGLDILKFNGSESIAKVDKAVDDETINIGKTRLNENIVYDSRLAWYFIPNSYKVFLDVSDEIMGQRLFDSNRTEIEKGAKLEQAIKNTMARWNLENKRYKKTYNVDNLNLSNYDLVIDTSNLTPTQISNLIYKNYKEFLKSQKNSKK